MINILVTGGSGTVGRKVLELLIQHPDYKITAFDIKTRKSLRYYKTLGGKPEVVYGDIAEPDAIAAVCHRKDFVIHLAAIIPPEADAKPEAARQVNAGGTGNLIQSLEKHSPKAFLLYTSSVSVYGDRLQKPEIRITDPLQPSEGDAYGMTKCEAERLIRKSSLSWSIFRLSAIMGAGNHKISGLMFHMPLETPVEITTPDDTALALVNAIRMKEKIRGKTYNLGGGSLCRIKYRELLNRSFAMYGLGSLDFPPEAFAEKNFHCGYYADGDELEDLLHFRNDRMETYFSKVSQSISSSRKITAFIFRKLIKRYLLKKSDPYRAWLSRDTDQMKHWFTA
jgi:nucleoside-diphosphate-sugar epimerase